MFGIALGVMLAVRYRLAPNLLFGDYTGIKRRVITWTLYNFNGYIFKYGELTNCSGQSIGLPWL